MTDIEDFNFGDEGREVIMVAGPSGAIYEVIHEKEKDYWENTVRKYLSDYKFTNISDLQDLDRVVAAEMLVYRYQLWVALERDYFGEVIDVDQFNKTIKEKSAELRLLKKSLGIDKTSREKDQGDSVASYIENLRQRAFEFGVNRNNQAVKAITLFQELSALIQLHDNCTAEERKENHIEVHDIIDWVRSKAIPEFNAIDAEFRETSQKYWIADL